MNTKIPSFKRVVCVNSFELLRKKVTTNGVLIFSRPKKNETIGHDAIEKSRSGLVSIKSHLGDYQLLDWDDVKNEIK